MAVETESITATFVPIISCLRKVEEFVVTPGEWVPQNDTQRKFISSRLQDKHELEMFLNGTNENEPLKIEGIASKKALDINEFLERHNFNISFEDFEKNKFGVASVMDALLNWEVKGRSTTLKGQDGNVHAAVSIDLIDVVRSVNISPILYLPTTQREYQVGITVPERSIEDEFDLMDFIINTKERVTANNFGLAKYSESVVFPKVDLDQETDVNWLEDMLYSPFPGYRIDRAIQQVKFKMNEHGLHAKSGMGIRIETLGAHPEPLVIDRPFITWIEKDQISVPLFAGLINYGDWKDPGNLDL